jgi:regulator of sirC expression with transglutaminase-like and TPR domain
MDPVEAFAELMAAGDPPLDRALALIAAAGRPGVEPAALLLRLDALAGTTTAADAAGLCGELFGPGGFGGDRVDYYDPDNSRLDRVLDRRLGIPITLAAVAMEVGRRRGIELVGVGMPGHFLLATTGATTYFDAFDGGRALDRDGCRELFHVLHGPATPWSASYLDPTPTTAIVVRVLNNLRAATIRGDDRPGLAAALRLQVALPASGAEDRRRLAGVLAADGRFLDSADLYDELAALDPGRAEEHRRAAARLRARMN